MNNLTQRLDNIYFFYTGTTFTFENCSVIYTGNSEPKLSEYGVFIFGRLHGIALDKYVTFVDD